MYQVFCYKTKTDGRDGVHRSEIIEVNEVRCGWAYQLAGESTTDLKE